MGDEMLAQAYEPLASVFLEVDATIERLAGKRFTTDPIIDERYSRITSIVSSAYKRHGAIIEHALLVALCCGGGILLPAVLRNEPDVTAGCCHSSRAAAPEHSPNALEIMSK